MTELFKVFSSRYSFKLTELKDLKLGDLVEYREENFLVKEIKRNKIKFGKVYINIFSYNNTINIGMKEKNWDDYIKAYHDPNTIFRKDIFRLGCFYVKYMYSEDGFISFTVV